LPIHKSWNSLISELNSTYCKGKADGATPPFRCKKAQSVFYAIMKKNGWDEKKPRPNNAVDDAKMLKKSKDLITGKDISLSDTNMARLTYKRKKNLPSTAFCDPENKKYPAQDAAHVRNGLARIAQNKNDPKYKSILSCLRKRAKKYGIKVSDNTEEYPDADFALLKDGERIFQHSENGVVNPELLLDSIRTIDYAEELTDEEWENTKINLLTIADEHIKGVRGE